MGAVGSDSGISDFAIRKMSDRTYPLITHVSNGYLAQSKEGRFTEVTSSNMQLNRIILTEPLLIFKFTESLVFKYYLT